jgi:hypothetical protein
MTGPPFGVVTDHRYERSFRAVTSEPLLYGKKSWNGMNEQIQ